MHPKNPEVFQWTKACLLGGALLLWYGLLNGQQQGAYVFRHIPCWAGESETDWQPKGVASTYDLSCVSPGFHSYFALSRWAYRPAEARNAYTLSESSGGQAELQLDPGTRFRMAIDLPAEGFAHFEWEVQAGTGLIGVFRTAEAQSRLSGDSGRFLSELLPQGSKVQLEWQNTGSEPVRLKIRRWSFYSPARAVRLWPEIDGKRRIDIFLRPEISHIVLPPPRVLGARDPVRPEHTGIPFLDGDGQPLTKDDQYVLTDGRFGLELSYQDSYQYTDAYTLLHRHWLIREPCTGNQLSGVQEIRLPPSPALAFPYTPDRHP